MFKFFGILLIALFSFATQAAPKVRVVYYHFPPDIIEDSSGKPQGATVEVWEKVAKRAGVSIEWVGPIPYLRALNMLEDGRVDAIYRLARTPEREGKFVFGNKAPFWGKTGIIVLKSEPLNRITSDEQISEKRIGWLRGGTPPPFLERNKDKIAWESVTDNAVAINIDKLLKKRIWGVYFVFSDTAWFQLATIHKTHDVKVIPFPGSEKPNLMYAAFSKKADPALTAKMLKAFDEESTSYDYEKISQKYIHMAEEGVFKQSPLPAGPAPAPQQEHKPQH